jgi:hypothetical protein
MTGTLVFNWPEVTPDLDQPAQRHLAGALQTGLAALHADHDAQRDLQPVARPPSQVRERPRAALRTPADRLVVLQSGRCRRGIVVHRQGVAGRRLRVLVTRGALIQEGSRYRFAHHSA